MTMGDHCIVATLQSFINGGGSDVTNGRLENAD